MNFSSIINDICCDSRIKNGIPDLKNPEFCFVMQEYLIKEGLSIEEVTDKTSILFEKGKFPDRQAFNNAGILVTFPTPEYRDKAISKGTHSVENPKKANPTIFGGEQQPDGESGGLSTADITTDTGEGPKQGGEFVTVDDYVEQEVDGDVDVRSKEEKTSDADVIDSMLKDVPLNTPKPAHPKVA
jgi:hypothetical protein